MAVDDPLEKRIRAQLAGSCGFPDEQRDGLLAQIRSRHGENLLARQEMLLGALEVQAVDSITPLPNPLIQVGLSP